MTKSLVSEEYIIGLCSAESLETDDPYDIWKTPLGFQVKNLFNRYRLVALPAAAALTVFDVYINNRVRLFYSQQEYPIVRALAALILLALYKVRNDASLLASAQRHLDWLDENRCTGFSGPCWGLRFRYAVDRDLIYEKNTPLTTMTPYALEAYMEYERVTGNSKYRQIVSGILTFLENDVPLMISTNDTMATAYSNRRDRTVINASSYVMYSYAMVHSVSDDLTRRRLSNKILKLYNFLRTTQRPDGAWSYSLEGKSFIDCFHSCIVLKNITKASRLVPLPDSDELVSRGYAYVKQKLWVAEKGLFKRFAEANKPSLVELDLYDNAEVLNLASLVGDRELVDQLRPNIEKAFIKNNRIYSQICWPGVKKNPGMLRWALMPYFNALTEAMDTQTKQSMLA